MVEEMRGEKRKETVIVEKMIEVQMALQIDWEEMRTEGDGKMTTDEKNAVEGSLSLDESLNFDSLNYDCLAIELRKDDENDLISGIIKSQDCKHKAWLLCSQNVEQFTKPDQSSKISCLLQNRSSFINDENKIMNLLSRQHDAKRKYVKFLKIELGLEAFLQITGTFYYTF